MKIVRIFGPGQSKEEGEGLWSLEYEGRALNEFERLLDCWQDPEYMYSFCREHIADIQKKFGCAIDAESAANELMDEADELLTLLVRLAKRQQFDGILQHVFRPLNNFETNITVLQLSKASTKTKDRREPKLRVYAVRMGENSYLVTGGAIKLTDRMEDRDHTKKELARLKLVRDWLKKEGIYYPEDLIDLS
jgi:hypothetical protein